MPKKKTVAKKPAAGTHKMPGGHMMSDAQMKAMGKKKMPMMARGGKLIDTAIDEELHGREAAEARREKRRAAADDIVSSQPPGQLSRRSYYAMAKGGTIKAKAKPKKR